jgi:peptide deformylase
MEIVKYPHPSLRRGGQPVEAFDENLRETAAEMLERMYLDAGVGLAAPQVDLPLNLLVLNPTGDSAQADQEMTLVNPNILSRTELEWGDEGCLSFPGLYVEVERHREIRISYQDLDGAEQEASFENFLARVIQHEMDHLQGKTLVDRMSPADRIRAKSRLLELEQAAKE